MQGQLGGLLISFDCELDTVLVTLEEGTSTEELTPSGGLVCGTFS